MAYKTASPDRYGLLKEFARENRRESTLAENVLWEHLRRNTLGVRFLRQHVIGDYIVDFVSRHGGLIIEWMVATMQSVSNKSSTNNVSKHWNKKDIISFVLPTKKY